MKVKQILAVSLLATSLLSSTIAYADTKISTFTDVSINHWAYKNITQMTDMGVLDGLGNHVFAPQDQVTKAEFIKMTMRFADKNGYLEKITYIKETTAPYEDVKKGDWYYSYIVDAYNRGFISEESKFNPNQPISREEMADIVSKLYITIYPEQAKIFEEFATDDFQFIDTQKINKKYINSVLFLETRDLLHGKLNNEGNLIYDPQNRLTRAESVTILSNIYNKTQVNNAKNQSFHKNDNLSFETKFSDYLLTIKADWGEKQTTGYAVKIDSVSMKDDETIIINYRLIKPQPGTMQGQMITYPKDEYTTYVSPDINYHFQFNEIKNITISNK
jgi:hypothetical protein